MEYILSRGNLIQWKFKNNIINIYDHSYNSDFDGLVSMIQQSNSINGYSIVVFTPLRECNDPQEKYREIKLLNNQSQMVLYDPNDEIHESFEKFSHKKILLNYLIEQINGLNGVVNIFIKGANSFSMIDIVVDLLEYLANSNNSVYNNNNE